MKSFYKIFILCLLSQTIQHRVIAAPLPYRSVVISGKPLKWQKKVLLKFLSQHGLSNSPLIYWDQLNKNCTLRKGAILQLCFKSKMSVIQMDQKLVKKTLGRLVSYAQTKKAHQKEGQYEK